jgi:G3E family GTPase
VVLNKCDLASLAAVSAVEDRVQELAPGVRMLRVRFGQVGGGVGVAALLHGNMLWPHTHVSHTHTHTHTQRERELVLFGAGGAALLAGQAHTFTVVDRQPADGDFQGGVGCWDGMGVGWDGDAEGALRLLV